MIDTEPAAGAWNMAVDRALAESVGAGGAPVLRFYRWQPRCLSLGRNQPAKGHFDLALLARRGIDVVRRATGGRAVLHHRELTYSVAVPVGQLGSPRQTYAAINRALVSGLRRLGVPAMLQPRPDRAAPVPSLSPCFHDPVEGEIVVGGRKLVGSAQVRTQGVLLQHGSLLLGSGQEELAELYLERGTEIDVEAFVTLADCLGTPPGWAELVDALLAGWQDALGLRPTRSELFSEERGRAAHHAAHFADVAWTWRC